MTVYATASLHAEGRVGTRSPETVLKFASSVGNLTRKTEYFPNLLDVMHMSIWERSRRKRLKSGGQFKKTWKVIG